MKRLAEYLVARHRFAEQVSAGCQASVSTIWPEAELPESESSYWRVVFTLDIDRLAVDKETYIKALVVEGFRFKPTVTPSPNYRGIVSEACLERAAIRGPAHSTRVTRTRFIRRPILMTPSNDKSMCRFTRVEVKLRIAI